MQPVNMLEAKSSLSRLVDALERGVESEIVIARNGKPAARLVPIEPPAAGPRLGVAKGRFKLPESIDADNPAVASLFSGEDG
jgi:antitoxin (DNA-binding transcriptional repressor) of toxin-antitoxin stability system